MVDDIKDASVPAKRTGKNLDSVSQFHDFYANDHHAYIARKAERLSTAVHMVTGFIAKEEPIRVLLRGGALEIGQWAVDQNRLAAVGPDVFGSRCAEMGSLLETAQASGLVSSMNAKLILDEYAKLAVFVKERYGFIRSQVSDIREEFQGQGSVKGQKDIENTKTFIQKSIKDTSQTSSRRGDILAIFNNKERISIKDAVDAIPGVSEKTLQRELLGMVADKMLIKEGERRWSTYIRNVGVVPDQRA
jgi:hypothetical protein